MPILCISNLLRYRNYTAENTPEQFVIFTLSVFRRYLLLDMRGVQVFTRFLGNVLMYVQHRAMLLKVALGRVDVR